MEIAIIPRWLIAYLSKEEVKQINYNILISNLLIILSFLFFKNSLIIFLNGIPHFCLIDKIFNASCPFCGTTRAFCEIFKGNIHQAYKLNSISLLVASYFIIQIPLRVFAIINSNLTKKINSTSKYLGIIILTIFVLNWIINL